jgi:hypothetical protein
MTLVGMFLRKERDFSLPLSRDSQQYPLKSASSLQDLSLNRHEIHLEG